MNKLKQRVRALEKTLQDKYVALFKAAPAFKDLDDTKLGEMAKVAVAGAIEYAEAQIDSAGETEPDFNKLLGDALEQGFEKMRHDATLFPAVDDVDVFFDGSSALGKTLSKHGAKPTVETTEPGAPSINKYGRGANERFSPVRWFKAQLSGDRKYLLAPERKALTEGTASEGGYTVFTHQVPEIIEMIKAAAVLLGSGVRVLPTEKKLIEMPTKASASTANWVGENAAAAASNLTFGQKTATPFKCVGRVEVTEELIMDSDFNMDDIVSLDIAEQVALAVDLAGLRGDGTGKPLGITQTGGVQKMTLENDSANGAIPTYDDLVGLLNMIEQQNGNATAWFANPRFLDTVRTIKDSNARPIFVDPTGDVAVPRLLGRPLFTTTQIPVNLTKGTNNDCSELIAGAMQHYIHVTRMGIQLRAYRETKDHVTNDLVHLKGTVRVDNIIRIANQFVWADGVRG